MNRDDAIHLATRLYTALAGWDLPALQEILHPELEGTATPGLPLELGGSYAGRDAMLERFWRRIGKNYAARAVPSRFSLCDDGRLLVEGWYEGEARRGGPLRAAFHHLLSFEGGRIRSLEQLTDSHVWHEALGAPRAAAETGKPSAAPAADEVVGYAFDDGLATITLRRGAKRNAINLDVAEQLLVVAQKLLHEPALRAVLIAGEGPMFTVGGDIGVFATTPHDELPALLERMLTPYHRALSILDALPAPIVCAVQGAAGGGGLGLLHCADIALAATGTRFVAGFAALGLTGDGASTWFLPRILGPKRAAEFYLEQRIITAEEALEWGLVNRVVAPESLLEEATKAARRLADGPTFAFGRVRSLLRRSWDAPLETQLAAEQRDLVASSRTTDARNAIASFVAKQAPSFQGK